MTDERMVLIEKAMESEEFTEKVAMCNSAEELRSVFSGAGIELSIDEVEGLVANVKERLAGGEELSEEALEGVSGGIGFVGALVIVGGAYVAGRLYGAYAKKKLGYCWG